MKAYSAKGAAKGKRTKKSGQSPYFVGYKKHTLRLWLKVKGKNLMVPLVSFIAPANIHEGDFLNSMIRHSKNALSLHIDIIVGDMGYISSEQKMRLRRQSNTAVLTRVRENMQPPKEYFDYGCPECPEGIPLCWDAYDAETEMHCYTSPLDNPACDTCWQHGNCYQELYVSPSIDEHHFGMIPLHTKVSQKLLQKIRPQVERGFENDKNKLYLNRFFVNSLNLANILSHLSDACQILLLLGDMKTNTKSKAKKMMKRLYTQMTFDFH